MPVPWKLCSVSSSVIRQASIAVATKVDVCVFVVSWHISCQVLLAVPWMRKQWHPPLPNFSVQSCTMCVRESWPYETFLCLVCSTTFFFLCSICQLYTTTSVLLNFVRSYVQTCIYRSCLSIKAHTFVAVWGKCYPQPALRFTCVVYVKFIPKYLRRVFCNRQCLEILKTRVACAWVGT